MGRDTRILALLWQASAGRSRRRTSVGPRTPALLADTGFGDQTRSSCRLVRCYRARPKLLPDLRTNPESRPLSRMPPSSAGSLDLRVYDRESPGALPLEIPRRGRTAQSREEWGSQYPRRLTHRSTGTRRHPCSTPNSRLCTSREGIRRYQQYWVPVFLPL